MRRTYVAKRFGEGPVNNLYRVNLHVLDLHEQPSTRAGFYSVHRVYPSASTSRLLIGQKGTRVAISRKTKKKQKMRRRASTLLLYNAASPMMARSFLSNCHRKASSADLPLSSRSPARLYTVQRGGGAHADWTLNYSVTAAPARANMDACEHLSSRAPRVAPATDKPQCIATVV